MSLTMCAQEKREKFFFFVLYSNSVILKKTKCINLDSGYKLIIKKQDLTILIV